MIRWRSQAWRPHASRLLSRCGALPPRAGGSGDLKHIARAHARAMQSMSTSSSTRRTRSVARPGCIPPPRPRRGARDPAPAASVGKCLLRPRLRARALGPWPRARAPEIWPLRRAAPPIGLCFACRVSRKHVVVLGAGFAGLELAARLSDSLADQVRVTLLDQNDSFTLRVLEAGRPVRPESRRGRPAPLPRYFQGGSRVPPGARDLRSTPSSDG